jgi:hypothetical protein
VRSATGGTSERMALDVFVEIRTHYWVVKAFKSLSVSGGLFPCVAQGQESGDNKRDRDAGRASPSPLYIT